MISVTDLRPGTKVKMDGGLWECVEYQHQKLGRGGAKVVAKFKNLETGATVERTFNSGEKLEDIYVETRELQYLYPEGRRWSSWTWRPTSSSPCPAPGWWGRSSSRRA